MPLARSTLMHCDLQLAQRLEGAEGRSNAEFVDARARAFPGAGTEWVRIGGAWVMYDGVGSPSTQTFGLGLFEPTTDGDLDDIEAFFRVRGADVFHEVSPLAPPELVERLTGRGYVPIEMSNVLFREVGPELGLEGSWEPGLDARAVGASESETWGEVLGRGWADAAPGLEDYLREVGRVQAARRDTVCFVAEIGGEPVAAGALCLSDGVALLAGASTIPEWRRRGAQLALLRRRLEHAAAEGCDLAMVVTQPGSASQRNAERRGFRVAYTRTKWQLRPTG